MKHKRGVLSVAMASIMLISLCAVVCTTSVSATTNSPNAIIPNKTGTNVSTATSSSANAKWVTTIPSGGVNPGIVGAPAVVAQNANSLDLFVRGTDNALWWIHKAPWSGWTSWKSLGGSLTAGPAAISRWDGALEVFVRGTTGACYSKWSADGGNTWSGWANVGGQILAGTGPAACRWADGYSIFVTGTNHQVYRKSWTPNGGWVDWHPLGGYLTSSPGAAWYEGYSPTTVEVVARGSNGNCYYVTTGNDGISWSGWGNLGGALLDGTGPALVPGLGFVTGTNHQLYSYGDSGSWTSLGGTLTSSPGAAKRSSSPLAYDVFVRGGDGAIWWKYYFEGAWHDWIRLNALT